MNLLVVMVTYNRLAYTKRTLQSFLDTVTVPFHMIIVDNSSTDGTQEWLKTIKSPNDIGYKLMGENTYPGKATNTGWDICKSHWNIFTHLMRLDNDMELLPGWCDALKDAFNNNEKLGQIGLDYGPVRVYPQAKDPEWLRAGPVVAFPGNVGGTMVIKRELYDKGLRYSEEPWKPDNGNVQEDCKLSQDVVNMGYEFGHLLTEYAHTIDDRADYPEYYAETDRARGMSQ